MGADDLIENGHDVAVINYHSGDIYENTYSGSRLSYYELQGTPTAWFDGGNSVVGGDHTNSLYSTYLPIYNQLINTPSYFSMEMEGVTSGMIDYELNFTIEKDAGAPVSNLVLHVAVTESDIQVNWQGMSEVNQVERLMAPNQYGTALDFSSGDIIELSIYFTVNQDWINENCNVVAFIQNTQTKEVMQGRVWELSEFGDISAIDASIKSFYAPHTACIETFSPMLEIANHGNDNLTSVELFIYVNGEEVYNLPWTGNLSFSESEIINFPELSFTIEPNNIVTVVAENPNGQTDQVPFNNTYIHGMNEAPNISGPVSLIMLLGDNPEEITWEVTDSEGSVLYEGGPYTGSPPTVIQQFNLVDPDCYSFIIYDEGGDGLTGGGIYKLYDGNNTIFSQGTDYGMQDHVQFGIGLTGEEEFVAGNRIEVYPNPTDHKALVSFELLKSEAVEMQVFNSIGALVYTTAKKEYSAGKHMLELDGEGFTPGLYFINLKIGESIKVQKLIMK